MPLARQLLADEDRIYQKLIDQFYFEHHVHLGELAPAWSWTMEGTVKESLDLFYGMREKGIPSHFWPQSRVWKIEGGGGPSDYLITCNM